VFPDALLLLLPPPQPLAASASESTAAAGSTTRRQNRDLGYPALTDRIVTSPNAFGGAHDLGPPHLG
jgi:hypothetical protein